MIKMGFPWWLSEEENAASAGDPGSIPGSGRSPGGGHATHSTILAWRIPKDRGDWRATVRALAKSQTRLSE